MRKASHRAAVLVILAAVFWWHAWMPAVAVAAGMIVLGAWRRVSAS
jgi:hypothetical protein